MSGRIAWSVLLFACCVVSAQERQSPSAKEIVERMVQAETTAWAQREHFLYRVKERSSRTRGHVWDELAVETPQGAIERLTGEDGKPLSAGQEKIEEQRIAYLASHPADLRRQAQRRRSNEARMPALLRVLPTIYLYNLAGWQDGCTRIAFEPNPEFRETGIQDRILHAMTGTLLIHPGDMRLYEVQARLSHRVQIGFGLLGEVSDQTRFSMRRKEVTPGNWEPTLIRIHVEGTILMMKSLSRDVEASRYDFKPVASNLTLQDAAAMVRDAAF